MIAMSRLVKPFDICRLPYVYEPGKKSSKGYAWLRKMSCRRMFEACIIATSSISTSEVSAKQASTPYEDMGPVEEPFQ